MSSVFLSAMPRVGIVLSSCLFLSAIGCVDSAFGGAAAGYDQQACVETALRRSPNPSTVKAARLTFTEECARGGPEACSALGVMNEVGAGAPANPERAAALYERSCKAGNVRGCANLGSARVEGLGGHLDVVLGLRLLVASCDAGDARGCLNLAELHASGKGASRDALLAGRLFAFACDHEEVTACAALARSNEDSGQLAEASELFGKACAMGDPISCTHEEATLGAMR
jgi:TPR repeat protein